MSSARRRSPRCAPAAAAAACAGRGRGRRSTCVHSAPAYVVGTDTSGSPVSAEIALPRSIALPPPSASTPSRVAARRPRRSAPTAPPSSGRRRSSGRRPSAGSRRAAAARCRLASTSGSSSRPQRTITRQPLAREVDERLAPRASARARPRARGRSPATARAPRRAPSASVPDGELRLDRRARDERDAVARLDRALAPTPAARARAARRGRAAACRPARSSSSITCADARAVLHEDQRLAAQLVERDGRAGERMAGRAARG